MFHVDEYLFIDCPSLGKEILSMVEPKANRAGFGFSVRGFIIHNQYASQPSAGSH
jgi:hypothetical protein